MDRLEQPFRIAGLFEWLSLSLLVGALTTGMVLGSGGSATARSTCQLLTVLCVLAGVTYMALDGRLRLLRSPLLALLVGLPVLAIVQVLPGPWAGWSPLHWAHADGSGAVVS